MSHVEHRAELPRPLAARVAITSDRDARHTTMDVVREGARAGIRAAAAVAIAFFVADLAIGSALFTAERLGSAVAAIVGIELLQASAAAAVAAYTVLHITAFVALGVAAAAVTHLARREPSVLAGALLLFVVAEVAFYGVLAALQATTVTGALTWGQIVAGSLVGATTIGVTLWRAHPEFRREFAVALGAAQP